MSDNEAHRPCAGIKPGTNPVSEAAFGFAGVGDWVARGGVVRVGFDVDATLPPEASH